MALWVNGEDSSLRGRLGQGVQSGSDVPPWSTTPILPWQKDNHNLTEVLICFLQEGILSVLLEQDRVTAVHETIIPIEYILVIAVALKACLDSLNARQERAR